VLATYLGAFVIQRSSRVLFAADLCVSLLLALLIGLVQPTSEYTYCTSYHAAWDPVLVLHAGSLTNPAGLFAAL
jgi:hypothetical protein